MTEHICAQDLREKELQETGYTNPEKAYFRLGRAIFTIEVLSKDFTPEEAVDTPIGLAAAMIGTFNPEDTEGLTLLQNLFGSTGYLKIICEGDPDCGFAGNDEILLTGYRAGLDDVIVEQKLLWTVHGSSEDIIRNFAEWFEDRISWLHEPRWETYDGLGYKIKPANKTRNKAKRLADKLRGLADEMERLEDMPEDIKQKFDSLHRTRTEETK